ncbi:helix-turn-helix domain-containing protein [Streptomyces sp. NPDC089799]|uniref:MarR family transcriptional regulator n=1 Tax=Streptomyces sp. NPDC089799 TaxID=3155066 RepID=UPI0034428A6A
MSAVELFLLGRTLMKIGEEALPAPGADGEGPAAAQGTRAVLITLSDVTTYPGSAVGEIARRTGLPQSQVSTAVARLKKTGSVVTSPDPADGRRLLVRPAEEVSERVAQVRATRIESTLAAALGTSDAAALSEVNAALRVLARHLPPGAVANLRS